jgi:hypothetical protein
MSSRSRIDDLAAARPSGVVDAATFERLARVAGPRGWLLI